MIEKKNLKFLENILAAFGTATNVIVSWRGKS